MTMKKTVNWILLTAMGELDFNRETKWIYAVQLLASSESYS